MLRGPLGSFELTKIIRAQDLAVDKLELAGRDPSAPLPSMDKMTHGALSSWRANRAGQPSLI